MDVYVTIVRYNDPWETTLKEVWFDEKPARNRCQMPLYHSSKRFEVESYELHKAHLDGNVYLVQTKSKKWRNRTMTEKEFDGMNATIALYAGCHALMNLYEDVRDDIPDELRDSFIELEMVLDDLRNPIYNYIAYNRSICIDDEEELEDAVENLQMHLRSFRAAVETYVITHKDDYIDKEY